MDYYDEKNKKHSLDLKSAVYFIIILLIISVAFYIGWSIGDLVKQII